MQFVHFPCRNNLWNVLNLGQFLVYIFCEKEVFPKSASAKGREKNSRLLHFQQSQIKYKIRFNKSVLTWFRKLKMFFDLISLAVFDKATNNLWKLRQRTATMEVHRTGVGNTSTLSSPAAEVNFFRPHALSQHYTRKKSIFWSREHTKQNLELKLCWSAETTLRTLFWVLLAPHQFITSSWFFSELQIGKFEFIDSNVGDETVFYLPCNIDLMH